MHKRTKHPTKTFSFSFLTHNVTTIQYTVFNNLFSTYPFYFPFWIFCLKIDKRNLWSWVEKCKKHENFYSIQCFLFFVKCKKRAGNVMQGVLSSTIQCLVLATRVTGRGSTKIVCVCPTVDPGVFCLTHCRVFCFYILPPQNE
jgi:hypothetical protein